MSRYEWSPDAIMNSPEKRELVDAIRIAELESQLEVAVKGLERYANEKQWASSCEDSGFIDWYLQEYNGYDFARECLKQIKGEKPNKP